MFPSDKKKRKKRKKEGGGGTEKPTVSHPPRVASPPVSLGGGRVVESVPSFEPRFGCRVLPKRSGGLGERDSIDTRGHNRPHFRPIKRRFDRREARGGTDDHDRHSCRRKVSNPLSLGRRQFQLLHLTIVDDILPNLHAFSSGT